MTTTSIASNPTMPNDLDILMAAVAEINAKSPSDLTDLDYDRLIAYHRHNRARRAAGFKTPKAEKPKVDILSMLNIAPKPKALPPGTVRRL